MDVSDDQARLIVYVTAEFVRRRQLTGQPIPEQVRRLLAEASAYGTSERPQEQHSEPDDLIDTETASRILRCTSRNVRRIATDLDGEQVAGRWIFRRATVNEYAHLKQGS
ncbi:hypothetical protein SAMN04488550_1172 [Gordonia malaquae]|uniref:Helix-turn-helix domain-containing protein n=1 Tax=Gordonia malaquae NBRC 108250 TaxID=1223542 RepID=M3VGR8_GORML|nr:hypothetical protein [Gordonia malaquae]GAC81154.1 hypothetical protein GM1_029_00570 [Gordonia malaquae NBRC 108250]SEC01889.1 hypothetical protein SAMN04488550_1172 [Gordonia malaquae]